MSGQATINVAYPIRAQLFDGDTALFPRVTIYNPAGTSIGTVDLAHISGGLYSGSFTFTTEGVHSLIYMTYTDAGHTLLGGYDRAAEDVLVSKTIPDAVLDAIINTHLMSGSVGEAIAIMRGMVQSNYILDNTTYNGKGLLTAGRVRIFKDAADTLSETSPIATFTIAGTAELAPNDFLGQKLVVTKDP